MSKTYDKKIKPQKKIKKRPKEIIPEPVEFINNEPEEIFDVPHDLEQTIYFDYQNHEHILMDFRRVQWVGMDRQVFITFDLD